MNELIQCDFCGEPILSGSSVWFENTADGGLIGHVECANESIDWDPSYV